MDEIEKITTVEFGQQQEQKPPRMDWHTAFLEAIKADLHPYRRFLKYEKEHKLNAEPLSIDVLVIKKHKKAVIDSSIAEHFLKWNVIEYKSPEDSFGVKDFYKVCAYAYLCAYLYKDAADNITLTIVVSQKPVKLIKYLQNHGLPVTEKHPGVYAVEGMLLPIRIIESKLLPENESKWIRNLRKGISSQTLEQLIDSADKEMTQALKAYLYVLLNSNPEAVKRLEEDSMGTLTLEQVLEEKGFIRRWEERGEIRGEARAKRNMLTIIKGINNKIPVEQLAIQTQLSVEEIEEIKQEYLEPAIYA